MERRVVAYLLLGTKHATMLAVSLMTLRRHWDGDVVLIAACDESEKICRAYAPKAQAEVKRMRVRTGRRNSGYAIKPQVPTMLQQCIVLQIDADTVIRKPLSEELWPADSEETVITQFSDWISTGGVMRSRISNWKNTHPEECTIQCNSPWPAINTGVVSYGPDANIARQRWQQEVALHRGEFIADEIAMQMLVRETHGLRVIDDRFNWSPLYGKAALDDVVIVHTHGRKATHDNAWPIWSPEFNEVWDADWGGMRQFCPGKDHRLGKKLREIGHPAGKKPAE